MKIFIVDDEYYARQAMEKIVSSWDKQCEIYKYENGKQAFHAAENLKPDIILTDIKMPILDGLDLVQHIFEKKLNIDTVIISGYSEFEYARKALKYGVKDYILKPIDKKELIQILNNIREKKFPKVSDDAAIDNLEFKSIVKIIEEMKYYITENYDKDVSLEELAKNKYYINYSYLSRVFKEKTGYNFTKYLLKVRMEKAKAYMEDETYLSVSEVALNVGYNDVSNFIQIFKKYYGYTPGMCSKNQAKVF